MNRILRTFLFSFIFSIQALAAYECEEPKPILNGSIDLVGGYRTDEISTVSHTFDPSGNFLLSDDLKARNITIGDIGLEGRLISWEAVLLRGFANYGWVTDGSYRNTTLEIDQIPLASTAKVHRGHVADFSIGLGYLFTIDHYFTIGPVAGWAYDSQEIKMRNGKSDGLPDPLLEDFKYKMTWQGPWIGFEAAFELGHFKFRTGYDFHFANWKGVRELNSSDLQARFSSKSSRGYGNAVFFDTFYVFCNGIELGVGFKYQYWTSRRGRVTSSFSDSGIIDTGLSKIHSARWKACEGHLVLGYSF